MDNTETDIPEEYKRRMMAQFERAAIKGRWITKGGKIVIEVDRPKAGRPQLIKALTIIETIHEI